MKPIDIIIVDQNKYYRDGLIMNLSIHSECIKVFSDTDNGVTLFKLLEIKLPDVILLDYHLPDLTGIQIVKTIVKNPIYDSIKIIIFTTDNSNFSINRCEFLLNAIDAGAHGYLLKNCDIKELLNAINDVHMGDPFVLSETFNHKELSKCIIKDRKRLLTQLKKQQNFGLSSREVEVIQYLAKGYSAKEIGAKLFITEDSITTHKDKIKQKLSGIYNINFRNTIELVVWAIKNQIIEI